MGLESVVHIKNLDSHSNELRTIVGVLFSPEKERMNLKQVRVILIKEGGELGNHWREYRERYGVIGNVLFTLEDIDTKEQRKYEMNTGDILEIPPRIALKTVAKKGAVIVCLSESYEREKGTHKYSINP